MSLIIQPCRVLSGIRPTREQPGPLAMPSLHSGCGAALSSLHMGCRKGAGTEMCLKALAMSTPTLRGVNTCQGQDTTKSPSQQSPNWATEVGDALVLPVWLYQGWAGADVCAVAGSCGLSCMDMVSMSWNHSSARREPCEQHGGSSGSAHAWGVFVYSARLEHHCDCKSSVLLTEQIVPTNKE